MLSQMSTRLNLIMASLQDPVSSLSGGNAQKWYIVKWLMRQPNLLLLDDPNQRRRTWAPKPSFMPC